MKLIFTFNWMNGWVGWEGEGGYRGREKILGCRNKNKTNMGFYLVSGVFLNNYYWGVLG